MTLIDWLILVIPILMIIGTVFYTQKYVKTVKDFLVADRTGGRYLITSVISPTPAIPFPEVIK